MNYHSFLIVCIENYYMSKLLKQTIFHRKDKSIVLFFTRTKISFSCYKYKFLFVQWVIGTLPPKSLPLITILDVIILKYLSLYLWKLHRGCCIWQRQQGWALKAAQAMSESSAAASLGSERPQVAGTTSGKNVLERKGTSNYLWGEKHEIHNIIRKQLQNSEVAVNLYVRKSSALNPFARVVYLLQVSGL